jgi:hypothetical protein
MKTLSLLLRKKLVLAALAAVVVGSGAYAFAASLNVGGSTLQAGNGAVTGCQTGSLAPTYTTRYDSAIPPDAATAGTYAVDTVTITNITAGCVGTTLKVAFSKTDGTLLGTAFTMGPIVSDNTGAAPVTALATTVSGSNHISAKLTDQINVAVS